MGRAANFESAAAGEEAVDLRLAKGQVVLGLRADPMSAIRSLASRRDVVDGAACDSSSSSSGDGVREVCVPGSLHVPHCTELSRKRIREAGEAPLLTHNESATELSVGSDNESGEGVGEVGVEEIVDTIGVTQLTTDELNLLIRRVDLPAHHEFLLPSAQGRALSPPSGYFTVFTTYFSSGFSVPPDPLLVDVVRSYGLCISQLTPNSFMYFMGFQYRLEELGLPVTVDGFHTLFIVKRVPKEPFFYFFPRPGCKFLGGVSSSRGPWKERFFYVRNDGWDFPVSWSSSTSLVQLRRTHRDLRDLFESSGLFENIFDVSFLFPAGKKVDFTRVRGYRREGDVTRGKSRTAPTRPENGRSSSPSRRDAGESSIPPPTPRFESPVGKQAQEGTPGSSDVPALGKGKGLFCFGSKNVLDFNSRCDKYDTSYILDCLKGSINKEDMKKLDGYSEEQLAELTAGDLARSLYLTMHLIRRVGEHREFHNKNLEEISKLREEVSQLRNERDHFREKYTQEVKFGKRFLKSAAGKAALEAAREEGAKEFQESDMFDSAVMNQASKIYEETVQDCRRMLRETGRVSLEDLLLLDPSIPMSFGVGDASKGSGGGGDEIEEDVPP